jgi:TolB protein
MTGYRPVRFVLCAIWLLIIPLAGYAQTETPLSDTSSCTPQIVFASNQTGDFELYLMDVPPDGETATEAIQLTDAEGTDTFPRWSPDGALIAYQNGDYNIAIIDAEGHSVEVLEQPDTAEFTPTWNSSGTSVAFLSTDGSVTPIGIALTGRTPISEDLQRIFYMAIDEADKNFPDWSPELTNDENALALMAEWDDKPDLWLYFPNTEQRKQLTDTPHKEEAPAWSPDGTRLAYMTWESDVSEIAVMDINTQEVLFTTRFNTFAAMPQWSPDGQWIVFVGVSAGYQDDMDLFIMDADGENVRKISNFEGNEGFPDWRPCPTPETED